MTESNTTFGVSELPENIAPLTPSGIQEALDTVRADPQMAEKAAVLLRSDPGATISHMFICTAQQARNLRAVPDLEWSRVLKDIPERLRDGSLQSVRILNEGVPASPDDRILVETPGPNEKIKLKCEIEYE